jgi:hypothetical protein
MRKVVLLGSVVAALVGASVAMGLGSGSSSAIKPSINPTIREHRVAAPSGKAATPAARHRLHRARLIYLETNEFTLQSGKTDASSGKCPRRSKAINGYFGSSGNEVAAIHDTVGNSLRVWQTFLHNFGPRRARLRRHCLPEALARGTGCSERPVPDRDGQRMGNTPPMNSRKSQAGPQAWIG